MVLCTCSKILFTPLERLQESQLLQRMVMLQMGDQDVEVTEEKMDEAQLSKVKAVEAMAEGSYIQNYLLNEI